MKYLIVENQIHRGLNNFNWSFTNLSVSTDISETTLSQIACGHKKDIRISTAKAISKALGYQYIEQCFDLQPMQATRPQYIKLAIGGAVLLVIILIAALKIETCKSFRYDNINGKIIEVPVRVIEIGKNTYTL